MNKRYKTLNQYTKTKSKDDWTEYQRLRNMVTKTLRKAEAEYWCNAFKEVKNTKEFWSLVKRVKNTNVDSNIGTLQVDEEVITDTSQKAESLNEFFSNVGHNLAEKFNTTDQTRVRLHPYRVTPTVGFLPLQDRSYIQKLCEKVNSYKAAGHDNITNREIKETSSSFSIGLSEIINKAITLKKFPSEWKIAKVKPAFKKGNKKLRENYRPLSLLSAPSKIFESIICDSLDAHINNFNLSSVNQWGFKKGMSTETLLLYLTETWKKSLNLDLVVGVLFIDFKKAFDTVDHDILESKLQSSGICGDINSLIMDYLANRKQYVEIKGHKSSLRIIEIGVPQGSLLGPRLFGIYVNDLTGVSKIGEIHLYADDTTAFVVSQTVEGATECLNLLAKDIELWCSSNRLTIHCDKTEYLIITPKPFYGPTNKVTINGVNIKSVFQSKCLGMIIDNRLTWSRHISSVRKSFSRKFYLLRRISFLPIATQEEIYFKTIIPSVVYGMLVWGSCPDSSLQPLEDLHARAARIIYRLPKEMPVEERIIKAGWKPLSYLYKRRLSIFMFEVYNNLTDERLINLFNKCRNRLSEYKQNFDLIRPKKELTRNSVRYRGPVVWNNLPKSLKALQGTKETFKRELKKHTKHLSNITFSKESINNYNKKEDFYYY